MLHALLLHTKAERGHDQAVADLISHWMRATKDAPPTTWFAIRSGRGHHRLFATFDHEEGRDHAIANLTSALSDRPSVLLAAEPTIDRLEVLAHKVSTASSAPNTKALLLMLTARHGREELLADLLIGARRFVADEPKTTCWFAIRDQEGRCGIFDVFPDGRGRQQHLTGRVPRELAKHAGWILGGRPEVHLPTVVAEHVAAAARAS